MMHKSLEALLRRFGGIGHDSAPTEDGQRLQIKEIRERLWDVVNSHLLPYGFNRNKPRDIWFRARCRGFLDVVSVETNTPFGTTEMVIGNARVGIHCADLNRKYDKLLERPYGIVAPTFTTYIAYVMPQLALPLLRHGTGFVDWKFPRDHFSEGNAFKMAESLVNYGLPWFEQFVDLESLRHGIEKFAVPRDKAIIKLVLLEALLGRRESAIGMLQEMIKQGGDRETLELYRKAENLLTKESKGPGSE